MNVHFLHNALLTTSVDLYIYTKYHIEHIRISLYREYCFAFVSAEQYLYGGISLEMNVDPFTQNCV